MDLPRDTGRQAGSFFVMDQKLKRVIGQSLLMQAGR
jgi:hypothetical protein